MIKVIKEKLWSSPSLSLLEFDALFKVELDVRREGIGGILAQSYQPTAYFSDKLDD